VQSSVNGFQFQLNGPVLLLMEQERYMGSTSVSFARRVSTKVRTHRQSLKFSGIVIQRLEARPEWRSTARAGMGVASSKRTT